jgi:hypothetical protein
MMKSQSPRRMLLRSRSANAAQPVMARACDNESIRTAPQFVIVWNAKVADGGVGKALVPITDIPANIPCDFCRAVPAVRGYPCEKFSLYSVPIFSRSVGLWMVCDKCSELVSAREWPTLAERAYQSFADRCGVGDHEANTVRAEFSELIAQFAAQCSDS